MLTIARIFGLGSIIILSVSCKPRSFGESNTSSIETANQPRLTARAVIDRNHTDARAICFYKEDTTIRKKFVAKAEVEISDADTMQRLGAGRGIAYYYARTYNRIHSSAYDSEQALSYLRSPYSVLPEQFRSEQQKLWAAYQSDLNSYLNTPQGRPSSLQDKYDTDFRALLAKYKIGLKDPKYIDALQAMEYAQNWLEKTFQQSKDEAAIAVANQIFAQACPNAKALATTIVKMNSSTSVLSDIKNCSAEAPAENSLEMGSMKVSGKIYQDLVSNIADLEKKVDKIQVDCPAQTTEISVDFIGKN